MALLAGVGFGAVMGARAGWVAPGPLPAAADIVVPRGALTTVADALARAHLVRQPLVLRIATWLTNGDGPLRAGEFHFPAHASLKDTLAILRTARPVQHYLTIAEGLTALQIGHLINDDKLLTGPAVTPAEGAVLPETYAFERGATRASVLARAERAMDDALATIWAGRAPTRALTSPRELLILASLVERETAKPDERPLVAAVFLNRLARGMRLQSDPTVVYAVSQHTGVLDRKLTRADLDDASPWNTYRTTGLPPGPIASPGRAALLATAHPAETDALYFVADGSGGHSFARTLADHNRNVARWREIEGK